MRLSRNLNILQCKTAVRAAFEGKWLFRSLSTRAEVRCAYNCCRLYVLEDRLQRRRAKTRQLGMGRISVVKRRHGLSRCRYKGDAGMDRWVGLGVIADNLFNIGRVMEQAAEP
jgi:hypothetical protein